MRTPTAEQLLLAWEQGLPVSPTRRAITLLAAAAPEDAAGLAALPVGVRDARLFSLRRKMFGEAVAALAQCPACGENLDLRFGIADVCQAAMSNDDSGDDFDNNPDDGVADGARYLSAGGYEIHYRLPTSADLLSLQEANHDGARHLALLARCVNGARQNGAAVTVDALPADVARAIEGAMADADPQAKIELALDCPACGHAWTSLLDIAGFLWREVDAWARRTLLDIHTLARAYGWSEMQILALAPGRRDIYLAMLRS